MTKIKVGIVSLLSIVCLCFAVQAPSNFAGVASASDVAGVSFENVVDTTAQKTFNYDPGNSYEGYLSCDTAGATYTTSYTSDIFSLDANSGKFTFKNDDVNGQKIEIPYTIKAEGTGEVSGTLTFNRRTATNSSLLPKHEASPVYKVPIRNFDSNKMPITGWVAPRSDKATGTPQKVNLNTQEKYNEIAESGVNIPISNKDFANTDVAVNAATYADNAGISYMGDCDIQKSFEEHVAYLKEFTQGKFSELMAKNSFVGLLTKDEPSIPMFKNQNEYRKILVDAGGQDLLNYCNLLPIYASKGQLDGVSPGVPATYEDYQNYLNEFVKQVNPSFLSYDNYCVVGDFPSIGNRYFENMKAVADKAQEAKIPFWTFNLMTAHGGYRIPTEADVQWQINTSLAFGAKGIQYFCYQMPFAEGEAGPNHGGSFITMEGKRTPQFEYGKKINQQIALMDEVLMNSTRLELNYLNGGPGDFAASGAKEKDNFREMSKVTSDGNLLMGCFDHQGKTAIYFVNNDLEKPLTATADFSSYVEGNMYTSAGIAKMNGTGLTFNLEPGRGMLLELTNYEGDFEKIDAATATVTLPQYEYVYTGTDIRPVPIVTFAGETLVAGQDYDVVYDVSNSAVTHELAVVFKNRYSGEVHKTYTVVDKTEKKEESKSNTADQSYTPAKTGEFWVELLRK